MNSLFNILSLNWLSKIIRDWRISAQNQWLSNVQHVDLFKKSDIVCGGRRKFGLKWPESFESRWVGRILAEFLDREATQRVDQVRPGRQNKTWRRWIKTFRVSLLLRSNSLAFKKLRIIQTVLKFLLYGWHGTHFFFLTLNTYEKGYVHLILLSNLIKLSQL